MNPNQSTTRLDLSGVATIHIPAVSAPPQHPTTLTWGEHARVATDRLRAIVARLGSLWGRFWAMGVSHEDAAARTITLAVPIDRAQPEPPNRTPWSDALKVVMMLAVVTLLAIMVAVPSNATATVASNPHPCAAYHWPHQAPAVLHCAVLKAPKGK